MHVDTFFINLYYIDISSKKEDNLTTENHSISNMPTTNNVTEVQIALKNSAHSSNNHSNVVNAQKQINEKEKLRSFDSMCIVDNNSIEDAKTSDMSEFHRTLSDVRGSFDLKDNKMKIMTEKNKEFHYQKHVLGLS